MIHTLNNNVYWGFFSYCYNESNMYKGQKWIKNQRDKHSFFMSFRIGYSFIKNVECILKIKQPYDDHLFQIQNINKRKKSENFFPYWVIIQILLVMRFLFALWSIYFNFDSVMLTIKIWSFKYPEICSKYLFTCVVFIC